MCRTIGISVTMDSLSTSDDDDFQPHTASTGKRRFKTPQRTKGKTPGSTTTKKPRRSVQNPERQHTKGTTAPVETELPTGCRTPGRTAAEQEARAVSTAHETITTSVPDAAARAGVQTFSAPSGSGSDEPSGSGSDEPPAETSQHQLSHSSFLLCPVCAEDLGSISDTDAGRAAHVNACLDAAAAASAGTAVPTSPPADLTLYQKHGEDPPEEQEQDSMQEWLAQVGAAEVTAVFHDAEIDLSVLPHLNDHDLQELGVADIELRSKILQAAAAGGAGGAAEAFVQHNSMQQQAGLPRQTVCLQQHQQQQQLEPQQQQPAAPQDGLDELLSSGWIHSQDCGEEQWEEEWGLADTDMLPQQYNSQQYGQLDSSWQQQQQPQDDVDGQAGAAAYQEQRQPAQHAEPAQSWDRLQENQQEFQQGGCEQQVHSNAQQLQPRRAWQQQQGWEQQDQQESSAHPGPLQDLTPDDSQQQQMVPKAQPNGSAHSRQQQAAGVLQSSITGFVVRQPQRQQQQQEADAKEQWRALFKRPKQPLGAHTAAQAGLSEPKQTRISAQGRVVRAAPQPTPAAAAAAAAAPASALPQAPSSSLPSWWPAWRRLPGSNIIVDCFGRSSAAVGANHTWVLTHFHADHYMGLSRGFKQGRIICSPITAALVRLKLRVPPERMVVLELGQEVLVEGTRLQLIDANHCPGAAMVVAHPPGGAPPVLHTGDARLTAEATRSQPVLQSLVGRAVLVLDTTYADPSYCFPPQQDVLDWVLRAVRAELFNPRCLFLFGTYTIGKERLFLHVASALQRKVYVAAAKRSIMGCLDLPPHLSALLTTNHLDANIHAVPMKQVSLEAMESLLLRYKGRYTAVVGFKPTGWSHAGGAGRGGHTGAAAAAGGGGVAGPSRSALSIKPNRRRSQRGTVVLYQVPYSEHSSCAELRSFVEWFKPVRIIPSVNNDNGPKLRAMMAAVTGSSSRTGPMDAFARGQHPQQQQQ